MFLWDIIVPITIDLLSGRMVEAVFVVRKRRENKIKKIDVYLSAGFVTARTGCWRDKSPRAGLPGYARGASAVLGANSFAGGSDLIFYFFEEMADTAALTFKSVDGLACARAGSLTRISHDSPTSPRAISAGTASAGIKAAVSAGRITDATGQTGRAPGERVGRRIPRRSDKAGCE